jgi:hypothetical protein
MPPPPPHLRGLRLRSIVRIDAHGSKDRAKDASPAHATISRACVECMRLVAHADGVPLLGVLRTSAVIGATPLAGGYPQEATDRPRPSFRRRPAKGAAFQKTRMPLTVTTREGLIHPRRDCSLRPSRRLSRSRRPHLALSFEEDGAVDGHCKVTVRSPADP